MNRIDVESETFVAVTSPTLGKESFSLAKSSSGQMVDFCVTHTLRANGFDASEDGTGRGAPLVPVAIQAGALRENPASGPDGVGVQEHIAYTLEARAEVQAVGFQSSQSGVRQVEAHATLDSNNGSRRHNGVVQNMAVRRLLPEECEALQGFPRGYTNIAGYDPERIGEFGGNKGTADGPRYRSLGNSMAVPVMAWIGQRIKEAYAND